MGGNFPPGNRGGNRRLSMEKQTSNDVCAKESSRKHRLVLISTHVVSLERAYTAALRLNGARAKCLSFSLHASCVSGTHSRELRYNVVFLQHTPVGCTVLPSAARQSLRRQYVILGEEERNQEYQRGTSCIGQNMSLQTDCELPASLDWQGS